MSALNPPASTGLVMCRSIGKSRSSVRRLITFITSGSMKLSQGSTDDQWGLSIQSGNLSRNRCLNLNGYKRTDSRLRAEGLRTYRCLSRMIILDLYNWSLLHMATWRLLGLTTSSPTLVWNQHGVLHPLRVNYARSASSNIFGFALYSRAWPVTIQNLMNTGVTSSG